MKKWQGISGVSHTIAGPGEYEIGGVFITGVASQTKKSNHKAIQDNVIYTINMDGVVVCYFGECGSLPTQSQLEILGRINALLIPVGIKGGLSAAMASEIVSMIEPDMVIPTHYEVSELKTGLQSVSPFLKVMGAENPTVYESLKIEGSASPGATQVVLLEPMG
jgi:L-ascorbate metabolism protein UlaG (beta-lactamase superfamily)